MEALPQTAFALAYTRAEQRRIVEEEERRARVEAEALAAVSDHVYDPYPFPEAAPLDTRMYEGTGVGFLYGVDGCEHFRPELGDWTLGKEPRA